MFVCICNAICDRRIGEAIENGSDTVEEVYAACGARPKCRTCADAIEDMIDTRRFGSLATPVTDRGNAMPLGAAAAPAE